MLNSRNILLSLLMVLFMSSAALAADYYVDASKGDDSKAGSLSEPWETLSKANKTLKAGDTVFIRGGSYSGQQIAPVNSGKAGARIIYRNYSNETPIISDSDTPMALSNRSYITVHGITITNCDKYLTMANGHYNHFEYLTISKMRNYDRFEGFMVGPDATYNWIHHCTISSYGENVSGKNKGDMVYIGDNPEPGSTHHNLIEDNHFYHGAHNVFGINGHHNVIRNNYMHSDKWYNADGGRVAEFKGGDSGTGGWNLIEGNRFAFAGDNDPVVKLVSPDNITRRNVFFHGDAPGIQLVNNTADGANGADNNCIYNNVFFYNGLDGTSGGNGVWFKGVSGAIKNTRLKNNVFRLNQKGAWSYSGTGSLKDQEIIGNWEEAGDPLFKDAVPSKIKDPFDEKYPDFRLDPDSPCINKGVFLTTTVSAGSGTAIQVKDAHYFVDGWGIIEGDYIKLENQKQKVQILKIDYTKNILTVDTELSWSANQGVALDFVGTAPDLGATETASSDTSDSALLIDAPQNFRIVN